MCSVVRSLDASFAMGPNDVATSMPIEGVCSTIGLFFVADIFQIFRVGSSL